MTIQLSLLRLSAHYRLSPAAREQLLQLSGARAEPRGVATILARGMALLAAILAGLSVIFWVAANWGALGRAGSFILLQSVVLLATTAAFTWPRARVAFSLAAFAATGGLLAYFGQTYQTGADPWQLFAWWSVLALPLCFALRRDALWAPWVVVTGCAILLWIRAHTGIWWGGGRDEVVTYLAGWGASAAVVALLSPPARAWTGAGLWALRLAALLTVALATPSGVSSVFGDGLLAWLALALLAGMAAVFAGARRFDVFVLSAAGLGLNVIVDCAIANILFRSLPDIGGLLLIGLMAAVLLTVTVWVINILSERPTAGSRS